MRAYTDEMSYQENLLSKYHVKNGFEVTIITSTWKRESGGELVESEERDYINQDGVHIIRLPAKGKNEIDRRFRRFENVYDALCGEKPDILFLHNFQYVDTAVIAKYIRNYGVQQVYVDNHADFSNSATNWFSKNILHKIIWKHYAHLIKPYVTRFYGVLPARVDFLTKIYRLPEQKCSLLLMGADDELAVQARECREHTRERYRTGSNDFLIVTGGVINQWKKQTIFLEIAVKKLCFPNVKLVIFGSIDEKLRDSVMSFCDERITYVGWLSREETYRLIAAADLAVYPGRHSILWEQTAGQGIPMLVKHWPGTHHIDAGGNAEFLYENSSEEIQRRLEELLSDSEKYHGLKTMAEKYSGQFLYSVIARESIRQY